MKCCNEMRWYLADTTAFYHFLLFWPPVVPPSKYPRQRDAPFCFEILLQSERLCAPASFRKFTKNRFHTCRTTDTRCRNFSACRQRIVFVWAAVLPRGAVTPTAKPVYVDMPCRCVRCDTPSQRRYLCKKMRMVHHIAGINRNAV